MIRKILDSAPTRTHVLCAGILIGIVCGFNLFGCETKPDKMRASFWTETQAVEDVSPRKVMWP